MSKQTKKQKKIILGVSGGIAAYKIADLASRLSKENYDVHVIMTSNATKFITPLTFETLTGNKCIVDTFDREFEWDVKHVSLAKSADAILIAPATANVIAKIAGGIADDMLTTTILAAKCPIIISPSMNTNMYENIATQTNIKTLQSYGYRVLDTEEGMLACKDIGKGRLPATETLYMELMRKLACSKDLEGCKVLITAGPTCENIDPVRYITNHSSGKMGYELARAAYFRGAEVTLITGKTYIEKPYGVNIIDVITAQDMFEQVKKYAPYSDIIIKSAAVADFTPVEISTEKIKKSNEEIMDLKLQKTVDILAYLGKNKRPKQILCGFSMETQNLVYNSQRKLKSKGASMIVANSIKESGAGFGGDTNIVTLITENEVKPQKIMSKREVAHVILDDLSLMRGYVTTPIDND